MQAAQSKARDGARGRYREDAGGATITSIVWEKRCRQKSSVFMGAKFSIRAAILRLKRTCDSKAGRSDARRFRQAPPLASTKPSNCATATNRAIWARAC